MNAPKTFGLLALAALCIGAAAEAQCYDRAGNPVVEVMDMSIPDSAMASMRMGRPVILVNPAVVSTMSFNVRRFLWLHECGHHALGHVLAMAQWGPGVAHAGLEQESDCYAIRSMAAMGQLNPAVLYEIQRAMSTSPGDATHLPGPVRARNLAACLGL